MTKYKNESEAIETNKNWFIDYCSKYNIECTFNEQNPHDVYLTATGKSGQKFTKGIYLDFKTNTRKELKRIANKLYNMANVIGTLESVLKMQSDDETNNVMLDAYTNKNGYGLLFRTIYPYIRVIISYREDTVLVDVIYNYGSIADTVITLANGLELVMESGGYDDNGDWYDVDMKVRKTIKVNDDKLDTLVDEVKKAVNQIDNLKIEDF